MPSHTRTALTSSLCILVLVMSQLPGCTRRAPVHDFTVATPGMTARINIAGLDKATAATAAAQAEQALAALDGAGLTDQAGSELQRINEAFANGRRIAVSDELLALLTRAQELSKASGGLFNPATGALTSLWEYRCEEQDCASASYAGEVQKLVEGKIAGVLKQPPSMADIVIRGNRVSSGNRKVRLDFGDLLRGLALDRGISALRQGGADHAMLEIGDSVCSSGRRGEHPWWAGITDDSGKRRIGYLEIADGECVYTAHALDTRDGGQDQGTLYRRVVDPRSGLPVRDIRSATVVHGDATSAAAAATAFMVAGPEHWKDVAAHMGVTAVILVTDEGDIYVSPAIDHRIHWEQSITHQHLLP